MSDFRILVTAIGSMSGESVIRSLREFSEGIVIFGTDINPKEWLYISGRVDHFLQSPKASDENYIQFIHDLCRKHKIDFVIPLTDPEVDRLVEVVEEFKLIGVTITISNTHAVQVMRDKMKFFQSLKEIEGLKLIPSFGIAELQSFDLEYPVIAKPARGRSSEGVVMIRSKYELEKFFSVRTPYIFQPFLSGSIFTVDVVRDINGRCATVPRCELIRSVNGAGIVVKVKSIPQLNSLCERVANHLEILGCINMEFIYHNEEYYLMDINPRFSAGVAFSRIAGYDFVSNHLKAFVNEPIDQVTLVKELVISKYYNECILAND